MTPLLSTAASPPKYPTMVLEVSNNWLPLIACWLVALTRPLPTPLMVLPPLNRPSLVSLTGLLLPRVPPNILIPALFTVVAPVLILPAAPKSMFSASSTIRPLLPSLLTPTLPVLSVPVAPPVISRR